MAILPLLDLQLLWAYQLAADLESRYGMQSHALLYKQYADQLKKYYPKNILVLRNAVICGQC
jgi:hypothetical protein